MGKIKEVGGFIRPFGVRALADGSFCVADFKGETLTKLGQDLRPIWTTKGDPVLQGPHSIAVDEDGLIYVTEFYGHAIRLFTSDGKDAGVFAKATIDKPWLLSGPTGIEFDPNGNVIVADYGSHCLLRFDIKGRFMDWLGSSAAQWTSQGSPQGASSNQGFDRVHAAVFLPDGRMLVADTWNHRLLYFDSQGRRIGRLGGQKGNLPGEFDCPVAIAVNKEMFVVSEFGNPRLQAFSFGGSFKGWLGVSTDKKNREGLRHDPSPAISSSQLGAFNHPYDVKFMGQALLVADTDNKRIQVIN